jgi:hypothetical protein
MQLIPTGEIYCTTGARLFSCLTLLPLLTGKIICFTLENPEWMKVMAHALFALKCG